jgi:hypothetical protein
VPSKIAPTARPAPLLRRIRERAIRERFDVEPEWREPSDQLASGYEPRW